MVLKGEFEGLLQKIGAGKISGAVYDTAWVAQLSRFNEPIGLKALKWLRTNQLPDGTWGTPGIIYHHERVVCTLAALATLMQAGEPQDFHRIRWAKLGIDIHLEGLGADSAGETAGFELVTPAILEIVNGLGLNLRTEYFSRMERERVLKLSALPAKKINRFFTPAFSLEMVGEQKNLLDANNLQEKNGAVACSSSATAWFYMHVEQDAKALAHLENAALPDGTLPTISPIDIFEIAWSLWNLHISPLGQDPDLVERSQRHLDFLEQNWRPGKGTASLSNSSIEDGDATAVVLDVLSCYGRQVNLQDLLLFEEDTHFRCFSLEANPSNSTNIHTLASLRNAGYSPDSQEVLKILWFLDNTRIGEAFWQDKWHFSPYYPTAHAVIACSGYIDDMVERSVRWLIHTQRPSGGWGYQTETAEETAYCLQALGVWHLQHGNIPLETVQKGGEWLKSHMDRPYEPLWIGKSLYTPPLVVKSAILSALSFVEHIFNP